jgi:uncharacterized protein
MQKEIWIDMINPSHPLFFHPLVSELKNDYNITITLRNRGETIKLAKSFGLDGKVYGNDYEEPFKKIFSMINRTIILSCSMKHFDYSISFENPMSVFISKLRNQKSILLLDNDVKYKAGNIFFQSLESKIKLFANTMIIPQACEETFKTHRQKNELKIYNGYKEDFYIADYQPDETVLKKLPVSRVYHNPGRSVKLLLCKQDTVDNSATLSVVYKGKYQHLILTKR